MKSLRLPKLRRRTLGLIAVAAAAAVVIGNQAVGQERDAANPQIKHVFIVVLENENESSTFGSGSKAPYLAETLRQQGAFLPNYYAIGHVSLDNYIAMVSGQSPNIQTQLDCIIYTDFVAVNPVADGQVSGTGCVYPAGTTQTVANLLEDSGYTWHGYMEDMAANSAPGREAEEDRGGSATCRHPQIGSADDTQQAEVGDQYATRHNPFVYFHSIIDFPTCDRNVVDYSRLAGDLQSQATTPNYSFITPNLCHDAHDEPCVDGSPGGLISADRWLGTEIPKILRSPAYNDHGLLIVTFDEAEGAPPNGDASACCGEKQGPNTINPGGIIPGPGGGKTGAVLLSPCISSGTVDETPYNHYSMLKSVEENFSLPKLGYSADPNLSSFGSKIFTDPACDNLAYRAPAAAPPPHKRKKKAKCKRGRGKKAKKKFKRCRKKKKRSGPHRGK